MTAMTEGPRWVGKEALYPFLQPGDDDDDGGSHSGCGSVPSDTSEEGIMFLSAFHHLDK